jgi:hypothetical protein
MLTHIQHAPKWMPTHVPVNANGTLQRKFQIFQNLIAHGLNHFCIQNSPLKHLLFPRPLELLLLPRPLELLLFPRPLELLLLHLWLKHVTIQKIKARALIIQNASGLIHIAHQSHCSLSLSAIQKNLQRTHLKISGKCASHKAQHVLLHASHHSVLT